MKESMQPQYIFEVSWEVCNKVGGIYTVLSTRAASMQKEHKDKVIFIGPDVWKEQESPYFAESKTLLKSFRKAAKDEGLKVRIGRWLVPGSPITILVDFTDLYARKGEIYGEFWEKFRVSSIAAYGDYDESSMFGYASGQVIECCYKALGLTAANPTVAHFNEWMTTFGLFYTKANMPHIGTLFTTHATSIGRSIAGNKKPLYQYFTHYNGDQMAQELNIEAKHSAEKRAAELADCFTTVSENTNRECAQLLEKPADVVTPNGFEADFVPNGKGFEEARTKARTKLKTVAEKLFGYELADDTLWLCSSGRYEFLNKGIDIFIESLAKLEQEKQLKRDVVALIAVPAYISGLRTDLQEALKRNIPFSSRNRICTHELHHEYEDSIVGNLRWYDLQNYSDQRIKVIFVPSYIDENDGIFRCSYYDLLIGFDMTLFPSYYEPWGYTPLESVAFHIPTVTTNLSGFGQWASAFSTDITNGVGVIARTDENRSEVIAQMADMIRRFTHLNDSQRESIRNKAAEISEQALWKHFMPYYHKAYQIALQKVK